MPAWGATLKVDMPVFGILCIPTTCIDRGMDLEGATDAAAMFPEAAFPEDT